MLVNPKNQLYDLKKIVKVETLRSSTTMSWNPSVSPSSAIDWPRALAPSTFLLYFPVYKVMGMRQGINMVHFEDQCCVPTKHENPTHLTGN